jgi:hypothetical protein
MVCPGYLNWQRNKDIDVVDATGGDIYNSGIEPLKSIRICAFIFSEGCPRENRRAEVQSLAHRSTVQLTERILSHTFVSDFKKCLHQIAFSINESTTTRRE